MCFLSLTFPHFLREFSKGHIVHLVTNVKKMKKNGVFFCVSDYRKWTKAAKVKLFKKMALLIR